jgi:hypothetical protein
VDCKYFSNRVKKKNSRFDGHCLKKRKDIFETDKGCELFEEEYI